jgi:hypothetical protein
MPATALRLVQSAAPKSKTDALDALRRLAELGLERGDQQVQDVARRVMQAIDEGRPQDLGRAVGAVARGGVSAAEEARLRQRDAALRRVRDLSFSGLPEASVAPAMISSFEQYEVRGWSRDRDAGRPPQSEPNATWHKMLSTGLRMPRTPQHLAARLDRPTK